MTNVNSDEDDPVDTKMHLDLGLGGMLRGLAGLVEKLGELAESGKEISNTGHLPGSGKEVKGMYGFTVKYAQGEENARVEPFGNIRTDDKSGLTVVQEIREPVVDIFEEDTHTLVVAEMPGISADDVHLEVKDDLLTISAERGDKRYRKEVLLRSSYSKDQMIVTCNNGILEIKCTK
jgi:HSP20 family protein